MRRNSPNLFGRGSPTRSRSRGRSQVGVTLIEVLVAIVVLGIGGTGVLAVTFTSFSASSEANTTARMNVLLTAFGESVKNLPYVECAVAEAPPGRNDYQQAFDLNGAQLGSKLSSTYAYRGAHDLKVVAVTQDPVTCPEQDSGTQDIKVSAAIGAVTRTAVITKRNPADSSAPFNITINQVPISPANDPQYAVTLSVTVNSPANDQISPSSYKYWCDGTGAVPPSTPPPGPPDSTSPTANCFFPADGNDHLIAVQVTDQRGVTIVKTEVVHAGTTPNPHTAPTAQITLLSSPACTEAAPCLTNTNLSFASTGPDPTDASIVQWKWEFGDGTPPVQCFSASCSNPTHQYQGGAGDGNSFTVRLTVTDSLGAQGSDTYPVVINAPVKIKPTVDFTLTPQTGIAPQSVAFDASASHGDGVGAGQGITNYAWEFGYAGGGRSGAAYKTTNEPYPSAGTYVVTLTVTAANGTTNFAQKTVVFAPLSPPIGLWNSGAHKGDIPLFRNAYFDFQWTNVPRGVGDTIKVEIAIGSKSGICGFLGIGAGGKTFTFDAGAAGTVQNARAQFSSSPAGRNGICATDSFTFQGRTVRIANGVTTYSAWSPATTLQASFF